MEFNQLGQPNQQIDKLDIVKHPRLFISVMSLISKNQRIPAIKMVVDFTNASSLSDAKKCIDDIIDHMKKYKLTLSQLKITNPEYFL